MTIQCTTEHAYMSARILLTMYGIELQTHDAQHTVICVAPLDPAIAAQIAADLMQLADVVVEPLEMVFGLSYSGW